MHANVLQMERPHHRMTPEEFNKRLAAIGPSGKVAATRWEHELARLFDESDWNQNELARAIGKTQTRVSQILIFGRWLNTTSGRNFDAVQERMFRHCYRSIKKQDKHREADESLRLLMVTPLIEKELAKPPAPPRIKVTPSKTETVSLQSLVKPGRWDDAKKLIDAMARARAEEMSKSMAGFYEKQMAKAEVARQQYERLSSKVNEIMTQAEYKLIRSCLHSDRQSEAERKKYDRAFEIFNRIGQSIKWE